MVIFNSYVKLPEGNNVDAHLHSHLMLRCKISAGSTILLLTSAVSPQRLFVRCEDVKESKTEDYIL